MAMYLRYSGEFLSHAGVVWRCEIMQQSDSPFTVGQLTFESDPLEIEWALTTKYDAVCGSSAKLRIESPSDRTYVDLYTITPGSVLLNVYRNDTLYWSGTLDPEFYEEPYERAARYAVELTFSDFGILGRLNYNGSGTRTLGNIVRECIAYSGINYTTLDTTSYCSTVFYDSQAVGAVNPPADVDNLSIRSDNFYDEDGKAMTMKEVLEGILQPLGIRMIQRAGNIYLYDLNGLYNNASVKVVEWSGDSQRLSVDSVANNVKITFSPYADSGTMTPDITYDGKTSSVVMNLGAQPPCTKYGEYGEAYTFLPDKSDDSFNDPNLVDFNIFLDTEKGSGATWLYSNDEYPKNNVKYFKIVPVAGGASECEGIMGGMYAAYPRSEDNPGDYALGQILSYEANGNRCFTYPCGTIPELSETDAATRCLRLSLEMMLDPRYNPFSEAGDYNRGTMWDYLKQYVHYAFVPIRLTLTAADGTKYHYDNSAVTKHGSSGYAGIQTGYWYEGEGAYGDAWLEYFDPENPSTESALGGFKTNRHNIGRADKGGYDSPYCLIYHRDYFSNIKVYESYKKMQNGEIIPYPPVGGTLELEVYAGAKMFMYGDNNMQTYFNDVAGANIEGFGAWRFNTESILSRRNLYNVFTWMLYKAPKLEVLNNNLLFDEATLDDIEYNGVLNASAQESIEINTICGSTDIPNPLARGVYIRTSTGHQIDDRLYRGAVIAGPEYLLISTLYSQYATRHVKLTGEATIDDIGMYTYTEQNQEGKKFILMADTQRVIEDCADRTYIELTPDEYLKSDND